MPQPDEHALAQLLLERDTARAAAQALETFNAPASYDIAYWVKHAAWYEAELALIGEQQRHLDPYAPLVQYYELENKHFHATANLKAARDHVDSKQ
jgi:hypothetical protein